MLLSVESKQLQFQSFNDDYLCVTYKPICSRFDKKKYFVMIKRGNRYYDLAFNVMKSNCNWVEINFLAQFVKEYNEQIIS